MNPDERRGWRAGVKLTNGETIWFPSVYILSSEDAAEKLLELGSPEPGRPLATHHIVSDDGAIYLVPAGNILYHVIEAMK